MLEMLLERKLMKAGYRLSYNFKSLYCGMSSGWETPTLILGVLIRCDAYQIFAKLNTSMAQIISLKGKSPCRVCPDCTLMKSPRLKLIEAFQVCLASPRA